MKLKTLLKGISNIQIKGSKEVEITGISSNSKQVSVGHLFFAIKGKMFDGSEFIYSSIENGAVAIVSDFYNPLLKGVTQIITTSPKDLISVVSSRFYRYPAKKLQIVGITGTNGKTTTSFLIRHFLNKIKEKSGLIGTNQYYVAEQVYPSLFTTPPIEVTLKFFQKMLDHHCKTAVIETSSHGLFQKRMDLIDFDVAIFTNLTQEHLDFHHGMQEYAQAKKKLFTLLDASEKPKKVAIINQDAKWSGFFLSNLTSQTLTYGIESPSDVKASHLYFHLDHTMFDVSYKQERQTFCSPLIGKFNVYNLLAAICFGIYRGYSLKELAEIFTDFPQVEGRMQRLCFHKRVFIVDYAHTPDALENCLKILQEMKQGKIITVFGCGGERDIEKRAKMGSIAKKYSDTIIITSDNPRKEDPKQIAKQILQGIQDQTNCIQELDRFQAIQKAYQISCENDLILIAGKGHEKRQIFAHQTIDFDDVNVIKKVITCKE